MCALQTLVMREKPKQRRDGKAYDSSRDVRLWLVGLVFVAPVTSGGGTLLVAGLTKLGQRLWADKDKADYAYHQCDEF